MSVLRTLPKRIVILALGFLLGMVLCAHGQPSKPLGETPSAPVKSVPSSPPAPQPMVPRLPDLKGQTPDQAVRILKQQGLTVGRIQTVGTGQGKPGTVVKQQPAANTPATKGGKVDLWILAGGSKTVRKPGQPDQGTPLPKILSLNERLFMEFPAPVHKVMVFDAQGRILQQFSNGRRFDITQSLVKTNAGSIYLGIAPDPGSAVPMRLDPRERDRYRIELARYRNLAQARIVLEDDTTMGRSEPANNSIGGAPLLSAGYVEGEVGGDDAEDYGKVTVNGDGAGTLVQVEVVSGPVALDLYDPTRRYLDGGADHIWIALAPGTTFYFRVSPSGSAASAYRLRISKTPLNDVYESNDSFARAQTFGAGQAFLGHVINGAGQAVGFNDYYKVRIDDAHTTLQVQLDHAGLASGKRITLALYSPVGIHETTDAASGTRDGINFAYDFRPEWVETESGADFPEGDWRILISEYGANEAGIGAPAAYGLGTPPAAYTNSGGYSLSLTLTH